MNLFGEGSPSAAAKGYFLGTSTLRVALDQRVAATSVNGDLFNLSGKPVSFALGAEYRSEKAVGDADPISQADGFSFGNPKSLRGSFNVKEAFGELLVPLLHDVTFAKELDFNGAVRVTDYSTSGTVTTWKAGATWDIFDGLRLRGTRSRDIRAPNLSELFNVSNTFFTSVRDPVKSAVITVPLVNQGNVALRPKIANTWTAGVVLSPHFIPRFRASVDFYDIKLDGAVAVLAVQDIVNRCFAGNTDLCRFVSRDAAGNITQITRSQVNVNRLATRGLDFELDYTAPIGSGQANFRGLATYVDRLSTTAGGVTIDRAGEAGPNNNGLPHWRFDLGLTYTQGPFLLFVENRYVGGGNYDNALGPNDISQPKVKSAGYTNLTLQYTVVDTEHQRFQIFFNVNNLFDKDPPLAVSSFFAAEQTNPVLYDVVGRMFQTGVRLKF